MSSLTIRHEERTDFSSVQEIKSKLEEYLRVSESIDWNVVNGLLQELSVVISSDDLTFTSTKSDPLGRSLVCVLLVRNPPTDVLDAVLRVFPESLNHNPVAFFSACRCSTPQTITQMMIHSIMQTNVCSPGNECPYPWILSDHVTIEGAKAMLQVYPQGVLQTSSCLSSLCPLDFFLMSPDMVKQRDFNKSIWTKFKLMLVAADCCCSGNSQKHQEKELAPVHVILRRILSCPDILDDVDRARHILWILKQLCCIDQWVFQKPSSDGLYPLHFVLSHKCTEHHSGLVASRELVKLLLAAHPSSAQYPLGGRLPIHMAVENGWPCHDLLLSVYPEALNIRDESNGFVPFQAAAMSEVGELSLDVTFELFRANPANALINRSLLGTQA